MASSIHPQLSHCGVYARDVSKMVDFYTNVVGLVVSDRGISSRGGELAFMTAAPGPSPPVRHRFGARAGGRQHGQPAVVQGARSRCAEDAATAAPARPGSTPSGRPATATRVSCYFPDPEGNQIEIYMDTPWYVPQPHGVPIDLSLPNDAIMAETEQHCRQTPGFMPLDAMAGRGGQPLEPRLTGRGRSGSLSRTAGEGADPRISVRGEAGEGPHRPVNAGRRFSIKAVRPSA